MTKSRKPFPSDVSDDGWALVAPYLTLLPEESGQRVPALREVFNGLRYIVKTGAPWRWMPNGLPLWEIVYQQSRRWLGAGCFEALAEDLRVILRLAAGRAEQPTAAIIDSRTLRSTPESGARAAYDGAKRKKGSKPHPAVDTLGHLLALHVPLPTPTIAPKSAGSPRPFKQGPGKASQSPSSIRVTPARSPKQRRPNTGSLSRSSSCQRPSAALSCCPDDGWSSAPLHGPHGSGGPSRTTSDAPRSSQTSTSPPSHASCSKTSLNSPPVPNSLAGC
jgi:transposase